MSAPDFLDTNILVYGYDSTEPKKQKTARELVRKALLGEIVISVQVLAEFAATLLQKASPAANANEVLALLDALGPIQTITPDSDLVRRAVEAHAQYGVHFYDGMILAAAERGGCTRIWSEDLGAGQKYFGVTVKNPFH